MFFIACTNFELWVQDSHGRQFGPVLHPQCSRTRIPSLEATADVRETPSIGEVGGPIRHRTESDVIRPFRAFDSIDGTSNR